MAQESLTFTVSLQPSHTCLRANYGPARAVFLRAQQQRNPCTVQHGESIAICTVQALLVVHCNIQIFEQRIPVIEDVNLIDDDTSFKYVSRLIRDLVHSV
jgi:hypothetical protein